MNTKPLQDKGQASETDYKNRIEAEQMKKQIECLEKEKTLEKAKEDNVIKKQ